MVIEYYKEKHYGRVYMYIASNRFAYPIAVLTRKKTMDFQDKTALENLGFEFKEIIMET